ncbi:MAG TPA: iron ABC transporter permease [Eubacteriaceae bacterium]|jgi:iron complex transport system permease protein|nr:iron ABC transporter permease [Eubacteriaceae bacterium]
MDTKEKLKYQKYIGRKRLVLIIAIIATIIIGLYATGMGSIPIPIREIIKTIFGKGSSEQFQVVIMGIRLPRIIGAILVGAILATSGAIMQCVLRNPLASATTLGVSQGAAFGAAIGIVVFSGGVINSPSAAEIITISNFYIVTLCAFIGGFISTIVVIAISRIKKDIGPNGIILAGVALSTLFTGGSTLLQYFADETKIGAIVFWTFGNLGATNWKELLILLIVFIVAILYYIFNSWNYNAMESGEDLAKSLGVNTRLTMLISLTICSFTTAVAVSFVGIINFVGLIAPHIMRRFVGNDYRYLIPSSAVLGSLLLILSDTFGRTIIAPVILPIGAITSFLGAPIFLIILFKKGEKYG